MSQEPNNNDPGTIDQTSDQTTDPTPGDQTGDNQPSNDQAGQQPQTTPATGTITQEQFNRALAARLEAERKKHEAELNDLRTKAERLKQIEDAQKTEEQKLRERLDELQQKQQEAEAQAQAAAEQARQAALQAAVVAEATKQGFADPMDAYNLLDRTKLEVGEDGTVAGLSEALDALAKAKPYLRQRQAPNVPPNNPARSGTQKRTDDDRRREYFGGGGSDFWDVPTE